MRIEKALPSGRTLTALGAGSGLMTVLLIAGVHGDEIEGVDACSELQHRLITNRCELTKTFTVWIMPNANPDGVAQGTRTNSNNVDLNRNLPTSNWRADATKPRYPPGPYSASEPETVAFVELVNQIKPGFIISLHSFTESLLLFPMNDVNEPYRAIVDRLAKTMNIPVVDRMNYEVFGSLSRWAYEQKIPALTVEILRSGTSDLTEAWVDQIEQLLGAIARFR